MELIRDKRFGLTLMVTIMLAGYFWMSSRYPDLGEKAEMASEMTLVGVSFEAPYRIHPTDPLWVRFAAECGNWIQTNKKGMLFGLAFATCLMTLLPFLAMSAPKSGFGNTFLGMLIGCPLGVCVNCATPIAKGVYDRGSRLELSLGLLLSSPAFNLVVLTMMFSLLPWYVAVSKVLFSLVVIMVGIPLICRFAVDSSAQRLPSILPDTTDSCDSSTAFPVPVYHADSSISYAQALRWLIVNILRNAWLICRRTVPFMLLAGALGAVLSILIPWNAIATHMPGGSFGIRLLVLGGIALLGTFLPVPIAFDVIVVVSLLNAGMPMHHATTLLFTLGIFSIYPFMVVYQSISRRVAITLFGLIVVVGIVNGVSNRSFQLWWMAHEKNNLIALIQNLPPDPVRLGPQDLMGGILPEIEQDSFPKAQPVETQSISGVTIERFPFGPRGALDAARFTRIPVATHGLDVPASFSLREWSTRNQFYNRCITTADIHHDGWPDVAISADHHEGGVYLFANHKGNGFRRQHLNLGRLNAASVVYLAFVDINNDGWLDLFFATQDDGNHYIANQSGSFDPRSIMPLPSPINAQTAAAAFADVNKDGRLDIYNGNWALGPFASGRGEPISARNQMLYSNGDQFEVHTESDLGAPTLSTLFSDLNGDGILDLFVGNDFRYRDRFLFGNAEGEFFAPANLKSTFPHTTWTTMSVTSADLDNDLQPELFLAQISRGQDSRPFFRQTINLNELDQHVIAEEAESARELSDRRFQGKELTDRHSRRSVLLNQIEDPDLRADAVTMVVVHEIAQSGDPDLLAALPTEATEMRKRIARFKTTRNRLSPEEMSRELVQIENHNALFKGDEANNFRDIAIPSGLGVTGWTWNAKFADLDLDGWQDLFLATGWEISKVRESNRYYRNNYGKGFVQETKEAGLTDYHATSSYAYCDFDQDGDFDLITVPNSAPVRVWRNNAQNNHALTVELRDELGNTFGIGGKVIIAYGPEGSQQQIREIKASGGFHSADAPIAHFGLSEFPTITSLKIIWPDGEHTTIDATLEGNSRYVITRARVKAEG